MPGGSGVAVHTGQYARVRTRRCAPTVPGARRPGPVGHPVRGRYALVRNAFPGAGQRSAVEPRTVVSGLAVAPGQAQEAFKTQVFDHTYPERMWPRYAGTGNIHRGIRFEYGDLNDLIALLTNDPFTRQAFLPIWFPEDTGATQGQRVPCTLGYHFIRNGTELDVKYLIRSCDITRHFHNDVYMTGRLLQYVTRHSAPDSIYPSVGNISMYISNLHMFKNDEWRWK